MVTLPCCQGPRSSSGSLFSSSPAPTGPPFMEEPSQVMASTHILSMHVLGTFTSPWSGIPSRAPYFPQPLLNPTARGTLPEQSSDLAASRLQPSSSFSQSLHSPTVLPWPGGPALAPIPSPFSSLLLCANPAHHICLPAALTNTCTPALGLASLPPRVLSLSSRPATP